MLRAGELDVANVLEHRVRAQPPSATCCCRRCASAPTARSSRCSSSPDMPLERCARSRRHRSRRRPSTLCRALLPKAALVAEDAPADARLLIGDEALRSALDDPTPPPRSRRSCGASAPACRWSSPSGPRARTSRPSASTAVDHALRAAVVEASENARRGRARRSRALRLPGRLPRPLLRPAPLPVRRARAGGARALLPDGRRDRRRRRPPRRCASQTPRSPYPEVPHGRRRRPPHRLRDPRPRRSTASGSSDDDAVALLRSRDLVSIGTAADELRGRRTNPDEVTFIVDRNVNYTNVCVTDCDFCAFYRRPGDTREGYVLPKPVIFKQDRGDARARRHRRC